nr:SH3 domain-containing protein [Streptococcus parasanguinis]
MESHEVPFFPEEATFTVGDSPINVRRYPDLTGEIVATYQPGEKVHYDSKGSNAGYRWISYIGASGNRNYMAIGPTDEAGNRTDLWGMLE